MTVKRFTVPKNYRCIQDNLTKEHYLCEDKTEALNLTYLLNELSEENEQLKKQMPKYKCMSCEYQGYSEIGCLCEKHDCWVDMPYECEDYKELEE